MGIFDGAKKLLGLGTDKVRPEDEGRPMQSAPFDLETDDVPAASGYGGSGDASPAVDPASSFAETCAAVDQACLTDVNEGVEAENKTNLVEFELRLQTALSTESESAELEQQAQTLADGGLTPLAVAPEEEVDEIKDARDATPELLEMKDYVESRWALQKALYLQSGSWDRVQQAEEIINNSPNRKELVEHYTSEAYLAAAEQNHQDRLLYGEIEAFYLSREPEITSVALAAQTRTTFDKIKLGTYEPRLLSKTTAQIAEKKALGAADQAFIDELVSSPTNASTDRQVESTWKMATTVGVPANPKVQVDMRRILYEVFRYDGDTGVQLSDGAAFERVEQFFEEFRGDLTSSVVLESLMEEMNKRLSNWSAIELESKAAQAELNALYQDYGVPKTGAEVQGNLEALHGKMKDKIKSFESLGIEIIRETQKDTPRKLRGRVITVAAAKHHDDLAALQNPAQDSPSPVTPVSANPKTPRYRG